MNILKTKTSRVILPAFALCLFILAMIWISYFRQRSFDRNDSIRFAVARNANLAVALEEYAIRTLHNADAVLQMIRMEYNDGDSVNLKELLVKNALNRDIVNSVVIVGSNGRLRISNIDYGPGPAPDFIDSPYFIFHSHNPIDSLLISRSELAGKKVIVLSRRLSDAKGRFAGLVVLHIRPSIFTSFYAQAKLLPNDIISLVAPNGTTYAGRRGTIESSGENISKSPLFLHAAQHADSFYFTRSAIRHIPTWFSYRKFENYPIIATVGSSEADILADFTARQPRYIIPRLIISILVILFTLAITRFLLNRRKLSKRLAQEEQKYQRLLTEQMIAIQEREREWIGRELHDNVNQVLTTVKLYLETAANQHNDPLLPRSMQLINNSITEIRNLSHQLSAPTLGTRSLVDCINALVETVAISNKLEFEFDHTGYNSRVIMSQRLALYRILQEQLNNIIKHAEATKVSISLSKLGGNVILTVRDNGKGFDADATMNGAGINNMISRAKVFNGFVYVEAAPGKGCFLTVSMPAIAADEEPCFN
jgi:signal transduction histidine kinase